MESPDIEWGQLRMQLSRADKDPYPINLESLVDLLKYKHISSLTTHLKRHFHKDTDYKKFHQVRNKRQICVYYISVDCFKKICGFCRHSERKEIAQSLLENMGGDAASSPAVKKTRGAFTRTEEELYSDDEDVTLDSSVAHYGSDTEMGNNSDNEGRVPSSYRIAHSDANTTNTSGEMFNNIMASYGAFSNNSMSSSNSNISNNNTNSSFASSYTNNNNNTANISTTPPPSFVQPKNSNLLSFYNANMSSVQSMSQQKEQQQQQSSSSSSSSSSSLSSSQEEVMSLDSKDNKYNLFNLDLDINQKSLLDSAQFQFYNDYVSTGNGLMIDTLADVDSIFQSWQQQKVGKTSQ